jgi:hypothetical protein
MKTRRDSTLSLANKLSLYKLFIRSLLTYAAPVWSNASRSNLHRLQVFQSKCLRVIGNYPSRTPIPYLHAALSIPPIQDFIYRLTFHFYTRCHTHPKPFVRPIGAYTLPDLLHQYKKYIHKRLKHILLWSHTLLLQCFFFSAYFFTAVPAITWPGSTVTPSHSECSAGELVDREQFYTVRYWSVCIYILQTNFYNKKTRTVSKAYKYSDLL